MISLIVATSINGVIGVEGRLPWRQSTDLIRFKTLTLNHTLVMGRKTYEAIGRPLPKRLNHVVTRTKVDRTQKLWDYPNDQLSLYDDLIPMLESLKYEGERATEEYPARHTFICGGAEIYKQALPYCDDVYLTIINTVITGDAHFFLTGDDWLINKREAFPADENNDHAYEFKHYTRIKGDGGE